MPIDPTKRIAKWNAKYNLERVMGTLQDLRPSMYANVQAVFPQITAMELQVKQTLDAEGVSIIQYPFYLSFGREMFRLRRMDVSGEGLATEAATLIAKWVARGLSQSVLEAIRSQVFDVSAPTP